MTFRVITFTIGIRPRIRGQFCRRGRGEAVCLPPAASLMDGPVSRNLQLFFCDKIAPGFWASFICPLIQEVLLECTFGESQFRFKFGAPRHYISEVALLAWPFARPSIQRIYFATLVQIAS